jgi:hypothetical protein
MTITHFGLQASLLLAKSQGIGADLDLLHRLIADDYEALDMLDEARSPRSRPMVLEHGKRGVFELQGLLLLGRGHRNLLVQTAHELAARLRVDAVRKLAKPLVHPLPERDPVGHRGRH